MPLFHLQERHKEGIRCESGTVPATVNPEMRWRVIHSFATVCPTADGKANSPRESQETCLSCKVKR